MPLFLAFLSDSPGIERLNKPISYNNEDWYESVDLTVLFFLEIFAHTFLDCWTAQEPDYIWLIGFRGAENKWSADKIVMGYPVIVHYQVIHRVV